MNWQVCLSESNMDPLSIGAFNLPEDVVIEILLMLPVKSLLRFKSVCKPWNATISSLDFINKHFHHHTNNTLLLLYWSSSASHLYCFSVFSSNLERLQKPDYLELPGYIDSIIGHCNGILCIYVQGKWLGLWNPATRRLMPLPFCDLERINQLPRFMQYDGFVPGFGMDPLTGELKIVVVAYGCFTNEFAVYKPSSQVPWTFKDSDKLCADSCMLVGESVFVNGFIYWWRTKNFEEYKYYSVILAFDLHNEVFEVIQMPEAIRSRFPYYGQLDSYDDSLVIFSMEAIDGCFEFKCVDIWAMKEKGSWRKLRTVDLPCTIDWPLKFWKRNKILVAGKALVYDPETQTVTDLIVEKKEGDSEKNGVQYEYISPSYYKESLASVKGDNELQDYDIMSAVSREFFAPVSRSL